MPCLLVFPHDQRRVRPSSPTLQTIDLILDHLPGKYPFRVKRPSPPPEAQKSRLFSTLVLSFSLDLHPYGPSAAPIFFLASRRIPQSWYSIIPLHPRHPRVRVVLFDSPYYQRVLRSLPPRIYFFFCGSVHLPVFLLFFIPCNNVKFLDDFYSVAREHRPSRLQAVFEAERRFRLPNLSFPSRPSQVADS